MNVFHAPFLTHNDRAQCHGVHVSFLPQSSFCSFCLFVATDHYSLSILKRSESHLGSVKHYRISRLENGWFYISLRLTFSSLQHLVQHYTGGWAPCAYLYTDFSSCVTTGMHDAGHYFHFAEFADGLCCTLSEPCYILGSDGSSSTTTMPLAVRRPSICWKDMSRCRIFLALLCERRPQEGAVVARE